MLDIDMPMNLVRAKLPEGSDNPITTNAKIVWFLLHNHMRKNAEVGVYKSPPLSELARYTGLTRGGVNNTIKSLENAGYIDVKITHGTETNVYTRVEDPLQIIQQPQLNKEQ